MKGNVGRFWKLRVYPGWLPTMKEGPQFTTTRYWTVKTLNEAGSEFFSSAFSKEFSAINIIISALWNAKERTQTHLPGLLIFREYKKSVLFLAAKCVVNFYNSNRKLWQVFVCVSYHLEGMFIHKAIQKVSDSLGLGWVWETAFFFFFFLHLEPVPRWFYWSRNWHLENHYCDHSPWPCVPVGKRWSGRCGVSLWRS